MKTLKCSKCGRSQANGKFCLDCGGSIVEIVTLGVQFRSMETARGVDALKRDVRNWLARLGVQQGDIVIERSGEEAKVEYKLLNLRYSFRSHRQKNFTNNLAAVEMFLHHRVIGVERGIETAEQAFAGYAALPSPEDMKETATGYEGLSREELKNLLFLYHPDQGREPSTEKFAQVKKALDRKGAA